MKILTILIFSGERQYINDLLYDISKIDQKCFNIRLVDWTNNKKILKKKKKIYTHFKKKIKSLRIYYQKGSYEYKYLNFINKFKSKYTLLVSDDDRLCLNNFPKILKYLKFNYSGITLSFRNFKKNEDLKENYIQKTYYVRKFNIYKDINRLGFVSCQIIKTELINKIFIKEKKNLLITQFPQNFIILRIINEFQKWKVTNLNCIFNRVGNLDILLKNNQKFIDRLKSEYLGYLIPIKINFGYLNKNKLNKIYKIIFFKNIISWLFLSIKYCGKRKTFTKIKKLRNIIDEPYLIKLILIIFYISPIFFLDFIRIIRNFFLKKTN